MASPRERLASIPRAPRAIPNIPKRTKVPKAVRARQRTGTTVERFPRATP
jgi:hypothetical protein